MPHVRNPLLGLVSVAVAATLLTGCGGEDTPVTTMPTPLRTVLPTPDSTPSPPSCPPSGGLITVGATDAALGLRYQGVDLVNCGTEPYELNGYPAVTVLDETQVALEELTINNGTTHMDDQPPSPMTLQPGERATAGLLWRNTLEDPEKAQTGVFLDIAAAMGEPTQRLQPTYVLDFGSTGTLDLTPWQRPTG